jgi:hydroxymethylbilane synthase
VVGTSSLRRVAQVKAIRSDLDVRAIRGNVDSRLRRLDGGEYDCLILAGAGLERLGLAGRITHVLRPDAFWPAVSQGALGIQIRAEDCRLHLVVDPLDARAAFDEPRTRCHLGEAHRDQSHDGRNYGSLTRDAISHAPTLVDEVVSVVRHDVLLDLHRSLIG